MLRSAATAMAGMEAIQGGLDVVANNLANLNTVGFKSSRADFNSLLYEKLNGGQKVGTGAGFTTQTSFQEGNLVAGNQPLDLAIVGSGFFQVQLPDGSTAYTRNGAFRLDGMGRVVDASGNLLLGSGGVITLPAGATGIQVDAGGNITAMVNGSSQAIGQIALATFPNPQGLQDLGGGLYAPSVNSGSAATVAMGSSSGSSTGAPTATIQQGVLESSNVSLTDSMLRMILLRTGYQLGARVLQTADQMYAMADQLGG